ARRHTDRVTTARIITQRLIKLQDRRAEDELLALAECAETTLHVVFHLRILQAQIQQWDRHKKRG
ncbi:MAG: hypothetical protein WCI38_11805, partial [Chthoniobacterales bacterium]